MEDEMGGRNKWRPNEQKAISLVDSSESFFFIGVEFSSA